MVKTGRIRSSTLPMELHVGVRIAACWGCYLRASWEATIRRTRRSDKISEEAVGAAKPTGCPKGRGLRASRSPTLEDIGLLAKPSRRVARRDEAFGPSKSQRLKAKAAKT